MTHYQVNTVLTGLRIEHIISLHSQRDNSCEESFGRDAVKQHGEWEGDAFYSHLPHSLIVVRMATLLPKLSHAKTILPVMQARTLYEKLSVTFMFVFPNKSPLGFGQF